MDNKQKLDQIISASSLTDEDKQIWQQATDQLEDEDLQDIIDTLASDPNQLEFLTSNLKSKISALQNNDQATWDQAVADEQQAIDKV